HREVPGRPELLGTTREFLDYFGLKSLDQLPTLAELKDVETIGVQLELGAEQNQEGAAAAEGTEATDAAEGTETTAAAEGAEATGAAEGTEPTDAAEGTETTGDAAVSPEGET